MFHTRMQAEVKCVTSAWKQRNCMPCPVSLSSARSFPPPPLSSSHWPMVDTHPTVVGRTHKVKVSQALSLTYSQLNQTETEGETNSHWIEPLTVSDPPPPPIFSWHKETRMSSLRIYQLNSYFSFSEYSAFYSLFPNVYKPNKCISDLLAGP